jgi:hypothetical protein
MYEKNTTPPSDISTSAIASTDRYSAPIDTLDATPGYLEEHPATAVVREHVQYHDGKAVFEMQLRQGGCI